MDRGSTLFLRFVVSLLGAAVLALCIFVLPVAFNTDVTGLYKPLILSMYVPTIPFFFALYQAWKLLRYIDKNKAFSELAVKALKYIKYSAVAISVYYAVAMPYIYYVADIDDAPGVVALGFVIVFASFVIATAAAVIQRLFQNAVDIKNENDLTV